ncbi:MAG: hypothetical protein COB20_06925 [SAR86 cluster bacterium]|uniref:Beta/gamma crystallin 'Greek key' domain-containing protein n=1 Tax=SAR86 cluster bacterium TaxID=2030880 RepID=A0A2A4X6E7_9GAMM|nr:MAG: hypothetical protein COB20_06925 [SAR86 cluster bacterium]
MRLIAKIFQHVDYGGSYRYLHKDVNSFGGELGFNDKVSSIIIYRGGSYADGDKIRFYQHANYTGGYLDLGPGYYPNIHIQPYSFGDKISSADFSVAAPVSGSFIVRLSIHIYQHVDYGGQSREILTNESKLSRQGFNDKVSSIRIFQGDEYEPGYVANFYQHADYGGGILQPGNFGPGTNIPSLTQAPFSFNDVISSVRTFRE